MAGILKVDQVQSDSNLSFQVAGANVAYMNASGMVYGNTTIGTSIITTAGITFPATQVPSADANTLDDYEEGTCTITVGSDTQDFVMTENYGIYVKVGKFVFLHCTLTWSGKGSTTGSDSLQIKGLPFTSLNNANYRTTGYFADPIPTSGLAYYYMVPYASGNTVKLGVDVTTSTAGAVSGLSITNVAASASIRLSVVYIANA